MTPHAWENALFWGGLTIMFLSLAIQFTGYGLGMLLGSIMAVFSMLWPWEPEDRE